MSTKFSQIPSATFWDILLKDRQTGGWKYNLGPPSVVEIITHFPSWQSYSTIESSSLLHDMDFICTRNWYFKRSVEEQRRWYRDIGERRRWIKRAYCWLVRLIITPSWYSLSPTFGLVWGIDLCNMKAECSTVFWNIAYTRKVIEMNPWQHNSAHDSHDLINWR